MVYGWLGAPFDEDETFLAVQLMGRLRIALQDALKAHDGDPYEALKQMASNNEDVFSEIESNGHKGWIGIARLFNEPYWKRTRIYQEATGPAPTNFFCGNHSFDLASMSEIIYMAGHFADIKPQDLRFKPVRHSPVAGIAMFRDDGVFFQYGDSLLELLDYMRPTESSEPRDKVYAILGMASDLDPFSIIPDYSKSLAEVYTDVVRFSFSQPRNGLQVLSQVAHLAADTRKQLGCDHDDDLPSWVPDYRDDLGPSPLSQLWGASKWAYNACGAHKSHNARIECSQLILQGSKIDQIAKISKMGQLWDENFPNLTEIQSWAAEAPSATCLPPGEIVDKALRTTILADIDPFRKSRGNVADWDLLKMETASLATRQMQRKDEMSYALQLACSMKRLCWTAAGRVGLVPIEAKVRDELYVMAGGQVPYVLRPRSENVFMFLGEAYIYGIMDGELFTGVENTIEEMETVSLE
ncbi:MAG: hypothetical protein Q9218_000227 [Villophora microphyllina]